MAGANSAAPIRVFLSYAWEDDEYRTLVKRLAARLRQDGIDARVDIWHLGNSSIPEFMGREIRNAERILILCSPLYRTKVHAMEDGEKITGVGWEHLLLTSALWGGIKERKELEVVLFRGAWGESAPAFLIGMPYIDLTSESSFEVQYRILLRRLHGRAERAPEVQSAPADLDAEPIEPLGKGPTPRMSIPNTPPELRIDTSASYFAEFRTNRGKMRFGLFGRDVERLVNNFIYLACNGFYDSTKFHRVVSGFVVQGGDRQMGTGEGGPGYFLPDDFRGGSHITGSLSMANSGPHTNGSQFFVTLRDAPWLDRVYSRIGQLESGWEVLADIVPGDLLQTIRITEGGKVIKWPDVVSHWEHVQLEAKRKMAKEAARKRQNE